MEEVTITITKFKEYNARTDNKKSSWYRKEHGILFHPDWAHFTGEELHVWDTLLALASYVYRDTFTYKLDQIVGWCRVKEAVFFSAAKKLEELECIVMAQKCTTKGTSLAQIGTTTDVTDGRNERTLKFDFDSIYKKYPRKMGKTAGIKKCGTEIKTEEDFAALSSAVDKYAAHCRKENTEAKFVKHFSTFMGCWRDWATDDVGKVALNAIACGLCASGLIRAKNLSSWLIETTSCNCEAGRAKSGYTRFDESKFERVAS